MKSTLKTGPTRPNYAKTHLWQAKKSTDDRPCIWMQAGVVAQKNCSHYYDCTTCRYDSAMEKRVTAGKQISWRTLMRKKEGKERTCRHALTGRADYRNCPANYNCNRCEFDQLLEDTLSIGSSRAGVEMEDIKGFKLAGGYYFHSGHTWTCIESGGVIRVGMDDFAFRVLGGPDTFDLPLTGQELNHDRPGWGIRCGNNLADVLSPVNGVITQVNNSVKTSPDLPVKSPYQDGWLFTVHNSDIKGAVKDLMTDDTSVDWLNHEITCLEEMIEDVAGALSADGGVLMTDVYGTLPALGWQNLTHAFLKT
jgi:glycine cleavage system H lipoate-binding protein